MTKQEYLYALKKKLEQYPKDFQNDILEAFEGHFQEGLDAGQTEDEIVENLGSVDEVAENIRMMSQPETQNTSDVQAIDDLHKSLNDITHSLQDALRSVSSIVSNNIASVMENAKETNVSFSYRFDKEEGNELHDTISTQNIHTILIRSDKATADIELMPGEQLSYTFHPYNSLFTKEEATLQTHVEEGTATFLIHNGNARLSVTIPASIQTVQTELSSGDLYMEDLSVETIAAHTTSGDIECNDITAKTFRLRTVSGDIRLEECHFDSADCLTNSGDIRSNRTDGSLTAKSTSGDIDLKRHTGHAIDLTTVSGDIDADSDSSNASIETISGDIEFESNVQFDTITLSSTSGDIDCTIYHDEYSAELKTFSGDIDIDTDTNIQKISKRQYIVGDGVGSIKIATKSGDIRLMD